MRPFLAVLSVAVLCGTAAAQKPKRDPGKAQQPDKAESAEDKATLTDLVALQEWLTSYKDGAIRLQKEGKDDPEALSRLDAVSGFPRTETYGLAATCKQVIPAARTISAPRNSGVGSARQMATFTATTYKGGERGRGKGRLGW
jgi:hypothetical protein